MQIECGICPKCKHRIPYLEFSVEENKVIIDCPNCDYLEEFSGS